jgi:hypothetical protein
MATCREHEPGSCWWCGSRADSSEHKLKRGDLVREYGRPPYTGARELTYFSSSMAGGRHLQGPGSALVKFAPSLCAACNNSRSQPFDRAWERLGAYLAQHEDAIFASQRLNLRKIYGDRWRAEALDLARYVAKHLTCRVVQELDGPLGINDELIAFLDGGAYPTWLSVDFRLDVGVRDMLRAVRATPCPEDPEAAEAGFVALSTIFVSKDRASGRWSEPRGGLHYRWLAVYWQLGTPEPAASFRPARREIALAPCDGFFGADARRFAAAVA